MSLEQIREARPVENSIHNVIQTLSVKLDSAARYGLYREDALEEGFVDIAELFDQLAKREEDAIDDLMSCLRNRLAAPAAH
jgi:hypothetical protein